MKIRRCLNDIKPYIPGKLKEGAIKLSSNENPLGPSPLAVEQIKASAEKISLYPDGACIKLREKLAATHGLEREQIIIGNGSDEVLLFIAGTFIEDGDNAVTSESTFSEYTFSTKLFGGSMKYAPMVDGKYQLDKILELADDKTRIVFLCNPNNPTGTYFPQDKLDSFLGKVPDNVLVVIDEAYYEYAGARDYPRTVELLDRHKNLLILRTFSKIYGLAGLRTGYAMGNSEIIYNLNKSREPFNVNSIAQSAAMAAIDDDEFIKRSMSVNEEGKLFLYSEFDELGLEYYRTEANFIFFYIKKDCMDAFQRLMDLGVTVRPMKSFGFDEAIRVTVGTMEQNRIFIEALKHIL